MGKLSEAVIFVAPSFWFVTWFFALGLLVGCGSENEAEPESLVFRSVEAGDLDPYGCPYVEPVPWESELIHAQVCGRGCRPTSSRRVDVPFDEIEQVCRASCEIFYPPVEFIACVSEDIPEYPYDVVLGVSIPLSHPLTGHTYLFGDATGAWPYWHLCWRPPPEPFAYDGSVECGPAPDVCFEEPVIRPDCESL